MVLGRDRAGGQGQGPGLGPGRREVMARDQGDRGRGPGPVVERREPRHPGASVR